MGGQPHLDSWPSGKALVLKTSDTSNRARVRFLHCPQAVMRVPHGHLRSLASGLGHSPLKAVFAGPNPAERTACVVQWLGQPPPKRFTRVRISPYVQVKRLSLGLGQVVRQRVLAPPILRSNRRGPAETLLPSSTTVVRRSVKARVEGSNPSMAAAS